MTNQTFFILKPDGRWICPRSFDGHHTCTDAGNGKDIVKLAGFVSSVVNYTKSSSTTLVTPPSKKDAIGESNGIETLGLAARETLGLSSSLSLRLDPNTLVTVLPIHKHALVLQTNPKITGTSIPLRRLRNIQSFLILLFGPPEYWAMGGPPPRLVTDGIEDMVDELLSTTNVTLLLGGIRKVDLPSTTTDQIDQALKAMPKKVEEDTKSNKNSETKGNTESKTGQTDQTDQTDQTGKTEQEKKIKPKIPKKPFRVALLSHGCQSVLHTRIKSSHLQRIMMLLQLRSVAPFEATTTPIYHASVGFEQRIKSNKGINNKEQWYILVVKTIQRGILVCEFPINTKPEEYNRYMSNIQRTIHLSCSNILPAEEPPVPLHLFVDHETVALCAYDRKKNISLCPKLRPAGPVGETERLWKLFMWFLSTALDTWDVQPTLTTISMVEGDIAFHAIRFEEMGGNSVDVYFMTAASKKDEDIRKITRDIVERM